MAAKAITVTDLMGRTVFAQNVTTTKGLNVVSLKLPTLASGGYIIKIDGNNKKKITVQ